MPGPELFTSVVCQDPVFPGSSLSRIHLSDLYFFTSAVCQDPPFGLVKFYKCRLPGSTFRTCEILQVPRVRIQAGGDPAGWGSSRQLAVGI
jgi:hypothetical protein